jgi:hypothetical protein
MNEYGTWMNSGAGFAPDRIGQRFGAIVFFCNAFGK